MKATLDATISVPEYVKFKDLDGEAVILNLDSGIYFGLDETGTRMWAYLTKYGQVMPAYLALLEEYDVTEAELSQELLKLLDSLAAHRLLQIDDVNQPQTKAANAS